MRTTILTTAGIIAAVTLTACGSAASHTTDEPKRHAFPSAAEIDRGSNFTDTELDYLDALEIVFPELSTAPKVRRAAVKTGHSTCDAFDRGVTTRDLVEAFIDSGTDTKMSTGVLVAATETLCPEYAADVDDFANEYDGTAA